MTYPIIHNCPVCDHQLHVRKLACNHCDTVIENQFSLSKFASLTAEQMQFVEVFVLKRGNIKEVEKTLGISYPTVRGKLNQIIEQLSPETAQTTKVRKRAEEKQARKSEVISMLEREEISPAEAMDLLETNSKEE